MLIRLSARKSGMRFAFCTMHQCRSRRLQGQLEIQAGASRDRGGKDSGQHSLRCTDGNLRCHGYTSESDPANLHSPSFRRIAMHSIDDMYLKGVTSFRRFIRSMRGIFSRLPDANVDSDAEIYIFLHLIAISLSVWRRFS